MKMRYLGFYSCVLIFGLCLFTLRSQAQLHLFVSPSSTSDDLYGIATAVQDVTMDGVNDLVISARGGYDLPGTVYLYSGADFSLVNSYTSPNAEANGEFGAIMQPIHNVGGSAQGDLLVGAPAETVASNSEAGRAYLVDPADGTVYATLVSPSPQSMGMFGTAGAEVGDLNGDGIPDLIVSAYQEGTNMSGRAYIFSGAPGFALIDTLNSPNPATIGNFGPPVATGDLDGDNVDDFAIEAPWETVDTLIHAGRVYVYSGASRTLLYTLESPSPAFNGQFGRSVAAIGDVDGDGKSDWVVCCGETINSYVAGKAYIFSGADGHLIRTLTPEVPSPYTNINFATGAAAVEDLNGDGVGDIAIGEVYGNGQIDFYSGADGSLIGTVAWPVMSAGTGEYLVPQSILDIDGDGKRDLMVNDLTSQMCLLYGSKAQIAVSPPAVTFGERPVQSGESQPTTIKLQNNGFAPLTFSSPALSLTGPNAGDFVITSQPSNSTLPFGSDPVNIGVAFDPSTDGTKSATLRIFSDSPTSPTVDIPLAGATKTPLRTGRNVAYVANGSSVFLVDLATGNRDCLTGPDTGSGYLDYMEMGITTRDDQNLFVVGYELLNVTRFAGDRTVVSGGSVGTGPPIDLPTGLAHETNGGVLVSLASGYILRVDPVTGDRTVLSGGSYGSGPAFSTSEGAMDVAEEADGTIVVPDCDINTVFRVDPATGDRTVLSTAIPSPWALAPLPDGNLVVIQISSAYFRSTASALAQQPPTTNAIYELNVADGTAQLRSGGSPTVGSGPEFVEPQAIGVAPDGTVYVYDQGLNALLSVDLTTGNRTVVSSDNSPYPVGSGPGLGGTYSSGSPYPDLVVTTVTAPAAARNWALYR